MSKEIAAEHKKKGNEFFVKKDFEPAIAEFTKAIENDPTDHVFYSNRSACYARLEKFDMALQDATKCVELKSDWPKGYTRVGGALMGLRQYDQAEKMYQKGLALAPADAALKDGLSKAQAAANATMTNGYPNGAGKGGGKGGGKGQALTIDPQKMLEVLSTPAYMNYMSDAKFADAFQKFMEAAQSGDQSGAMTALDSEPRLMEVVQASMMQNFKPPQPKDDKPKPKEKKPEPVDERCHWRVTHAILPFQKAVANLMVLCRRTDVAPRGMRSCRDDKSKAADEFKKAGNDLYKAKKFDEAIAEYDKAIEAQPNDITYYNNKAAVLVEQNKLDEAEKMLTECIDKRYDMGRECKDGASFEKVAKVFVRLGTIYRKKGDFDKAIEVLEKATLENNTGSTRTALRDAQKAKSDQEKKAYENPELAEHNREKGNEFFKNKQWVDAKKEYDDAVRRAPREAKLYSNRAAALQKLMAYPDALKDLEKCLQLDPKFIKAYIRKGQAHITMKDFNKAIETFNKGLEIEPDNQELKAGLMQAQRAIAANSQGAERGARNDGAITVLKKMLAEVHLRRGIALRKRWPSVGRCGPCAPVEGARLTLTKSSPRNWLLKTVPGRERGERQQGHCSYVTAALLEYFRLDMGSWRECSGKWFCGRVPTS
eukprot:gene484-491_t